MSNYKLFDHTADIGVEVSGRTSKELFVNAPEAFASLAPIHINNIRLINLGENNE
jgi:SHS2 domain-containing protein